MKLSIEFREELASLLGPAGVEWGESLLVEWTRNTLDSPRRLLAVAKPSLQAQVIDVVKLCARHRVPYYPVSSGKNWGYGGATPVLNDGLLLDLSRLKRIVEFNENLSYVVVEPGVTQQDLYDYMQARKLEFMVPTTGAGPRASLLGNALERGYGITPEADHFLSLLSLKAVLPDGRLYTSALSELGGSQVDPVFKWKIGPYLDGLFTQSNLGVVLEGTIALVDRPENVTQFMVFLNDEEFEPAVQAIQAIKRKVGGLIGGINLMNKRRLLAMTGENRNQERALEEIRAIEYAKKVGLPDWAIVGALYGPDELVHGASRIIKKETAAFSRRVLSFSRRKYEWTHRLLSMVPLRNLRKMFENVGRGLEILEGKPSNVAMPLSYLRNRNGRPAGELNPDRDDCGLIWFSPLLPLDPPIVRDFVQETTRICLAYDMDPLITLTAFSGRCFDSTIPLLYSKQLAGESDKAKRCYEDLLSECRRMGLFPYRLDIDHMNRMLADSRVTAFGLAQQIKAAIDPYHLLAPGRYIHFRPDETP